MQFARGFVEVFLSLGRLCPLVQIFFLRNCQTRRLSVRYNTAYPYAQLITLFVDVNKPLLRASICSQRIQEEVSENEAAITLYAFLQSLERPIGVIETEVGALRFLPNKMNVADRCMPSTSILVAHLY
jgi:hypothetical protein